MTLFRTLFSGLQGRQPRIITMESQQCVCMRVTSARLAPGPGLFTP